MWRRSLSESNEVVGSISEKSAVQQDEQEVEESSLHIPLNDICAQLPDVVRFHVHDAIQSVGCLPPQDTAAYRQAMESNPEVVRTESDPLHFVRYCKYDLWAGATRLCLYWKERVRLFGLERAFLPLTLSGLGALDEQDCLAVHCGSTCILPPSARTGKSCLITDRRKWLPQLTTANKLRCLFYIFHRIILDNPRTALEEGAALTFMLLVTQRDQNVDWNFMRQSFTCIRSVFPIKLQLHLLSIPNYKRRSMAAEVIESSVHMLRDLFLCGTSSTSSTTTTNHTDSSFYVPSIRVHVQSEPGRILHDLMGLGLSRHGIPLILGGEWQYESFYTWCQERARIDQEQDESHQQHVTNTRLPSPHHEEPGGQEQETKKESSVHQWSGHESGQSSQPLSVHSSGFSSSSSFVGAPETARAGGSSIQRSLSAGYYPPSYPAARPSGTDTTTLLAQQVLADSSTTASTRMAPPPQDPITSSSSFLFSAAPSSLWASSSSAGLSMARNAVDRATAAWQEGKVETSGGGTTTTTGLLEDHNWMSYYANEQQNQEIEEEEDSKPPSISSRSPRTMATVAGAATRAGPQLGASSSPSSLPVNRTAASPSPTAASAGTTAGIMSAIRTTSTQEERMAKRRLADLFYSRRKRLKRKQEEHSLVQEHRTLQMEHESLLRERTRLQELLRRAQAIVGEEGIQPELYQGIEE